MVKKSQKVFYSIGEVAEMLDVSPSLVRFWEKRFESIAPRKSETGKRLYSDADVQNLKTVYHLVKERGMTLAGAEMQLKTRRSGTERDMEIAERLATIRALLIEVRNELGGPGVVVDNDDSDNYELRITNYESSTTNISSESSTDYEAEKTSDSSFAPEEIYDKPEVFDRLSDLSNLSGESDEGDGPEEMLDGPDNSFEIFDDESKDENDDELEDKHSDNQKVTPPAAIEQTLF